MLINWFKQVILRLFSQVQSSRSIKSQQIREDIQRGAGLEPDSGRDKIQIPAWDDIPQDIRDATGDNKILAIKLLRERGEKLRGKAEMS